MKNDAAIQKTLKDLMGVQMVAVLATHNDGLPHGSLVAFVVSDDLRDVVFATSRSTRKFANLSKDARVALVIDNRTNQEADFQQAIAVTVSGKASEMSGDEHAHWMKRYLQRHPCLQEFVLSPTCALIRVHVEKYNLVERFQNVVEMRIEP
ncbi:MAG: pyridoxamine 5'-phosphate oxidase family protein [Proteobacteria bacterium]|nr:pyridoxamine 5'-phosphate oxidase family protein [Pseudomonadota bacterium]